VRISFSERLLKGSVKKSYAPVVDIDWDAPLDPDKFYLPPRTVSLYGTPIWDQMTRAQRIELSRQELVNTLSAGIWFENILNQALLRKIMHTDPTSPSTHYALTELGDETRHMVMFGKAIERVGARPVRPRLYHRMIINTLPFFFRGSVLWVAALIGEEIFDSLHAEVPLLERGRFSSTSDADDGWEESSEDGFIGLQPSFNSPLSFGLPSNPSNVAELLAVSALVLR
jgi:P-aminobenzoate N-oxygenase AurF